MKNIKKFWIVVLSAIILLNMSPASLLAQPDLTGRDPNHPVSLTIHHRTLPDGNITPGNPSSPGFPNPVGIPVVGAIWQIQQIDLPSGFDWNDNTAVASIPVDWLVDSPITQTTNASGEALFTGMSQGIFLVTELPSSVTSEAEIHRPFLVELPLFFDNEWVYDVHVYPKKETEAPLFGKDLADEDGHIVSWRFSVNIMSGLATLLPIENSTPPSFIRVVDVLDSRLEFVANSVRISFETATGVFQDLPEGASNWTYEWNQITNTLTTNILADGRDIIAASGIVGGSIRIDFDTSIENVPPSDFGTLYNTGTLYYGPRPGQTIGDEPGDQIPYTRIFGLDILKVNTRNIPLSDAVFHLYRQSDVEEYDGALRVRPGATPLAVLTSDTDGLAFLGGLTEGTYLLVEQQAPTGYNAFTGPITLIIDQTTANESHVVEATITNSSGFELPLTGGTGTMIFTIVGLSLIGASIFFILFYMKSRRENERN